MQFCQLRRREFIALLGGAAIASPRAAFAQADRVRRLGVLMSASETDSEGQARVAALRQGLQELGWTEGRNIKIDYRWTVGNPALARTLAAELVALNPEVIFAAPTAALAAMQRETGTIPIVFAQVTDPVGAGFVASLARPGGNMTGFSQFEFSVGAKWVELLKQIAPSVDRAAIIYDPAQPTSTAYIAVIDQAASSLGVRTQTYAVHNKDEIERAINGFAAEPNGGLIPLPGPLIAVERDLIVSMATRHSLPNVYSFRYYPASGGLASYGVDNHDLYRRSASYIDRILKGAKPADLPVQEATKFELVINLKTAKALGLDIPISVLAPTDEVIE
jgi:putative tryptophan/tyrosine transport system substrate-binding protein